MNATVQKLQDRKETYWRYTRASIWIEFFDINAAVPPPFTIFSIFWTIFFAIWFLIRFVVIQIKDHIILRKSGCKKRLTPCKPSQVNWKRRQDHANLMVNISERFLAKQRKADGSNQDVKKDDLITLRTQVVQEVVQELRKKFKISLRSTSTFFSSSTESG